RLLDLAAPAVAASDENSRQRSARVATTGPADGAKVSHRAFAMGGPGAGGAEGAAGALPHQPVRGLWRTEGRAANSLACLAGAARNDALAQPPDHQRTAPADGARVDNPMSAGRVADSQLGPAQRCGPRFLAKHGLRELQLNGIASLGRWAQPKEPQSHRRRTGRTAGS